MEFISNHSGAFHKGFRVSISHSVRRKMHGETIISPCQKLIASTPSQGYIYSAKNWFKKATDCNWSLLGDAHQRVWLEIRTKAERNQTRLEPITDNSPSACFNQLAIIDSQEQSKFIFCKSNLTRPHHLLSRGNHLSVQFSSLNGSLNGQELDFTIFYMFVDVDDDETHVKGTLCNHVINKWNGTISLLSNRLLLRQKNLKCRYEIQAPANHRIQLEIRSVKFDPIHQCDNASVVECTSPSSNFDKLIVFDHDIIQCVCNSNNNIATITTASNLINIELELRNIFNQAYKDTNIYSFEIDYTTIPNRCGKMANNGAQGAIHLNNANLNGESCSWLIRIPYNDRVLFKVSNLILGDDCETSYLIIRYLENGSKEEHKFCSQNQNSEFLSPFPTRFAYIELKSALSQLQFHIKWNILTAEQTGNCPFLCPNSTWCIPNSLVCDGSIHCPQNELYGYLLDEEPKKCAPNHLQYYYYQWFFVVMALITGVFISLFAVLINVWRDRKLRTGRK